MSRKQFVVLAVVGSNSGGDSHEIRRGQDGVVYCTCLGWRYSPQPKTCAHLRAYDRDVVAHPDVVLTPVPAQPMLRERAKQALASLRASEQRLRSGQSVSRSDLANSLAAAVVALEAFMNAAPAALSVAPAVPALDVGESRNVRRIILED